MKLYKRGQRTWMNRDKLFQRLRQRSRNPEEEFKDKYLDKLKIFYFVNCKYFNCVTLKRAVSVILSYPPCKDSKVRFTTVPLKPLFDQLYGRYCRFSRFITIQF